MKPRKDFPFLFCLLIWAFTIFYVGASLYHAAFQPGIAL